MVGERKSGKDFKSKFLQLFESAWEPQDLVDGLINEF